MARHTIAEIKALLNKLDGSKADAIEGESLECKPWETHPGAYQSQIKELRETAVSFANQRGGTIILGVADGKLTRREAIQGVGDLNPADLRKKIYDGTEPHILVDIEELIEPEGRLLLIYVPKGMPPHTTSEGVAKIRIGKETKPLTGSDLAGILFSGGRGDLTAETLPGAALADLDGEEIRRLRRTIDTEAPQNKTLNQLSDVELLENLGLIRDGGISLAAALILGKAGALARWAPQHEVVFLRYKTSTTYDVRHDLKGPLLSVLDALRRLMEANLQLMTMATEGFGELTLPDMTWYAAREAVLNALIHRDYFLRQSVYIHLRKDRLEITSPGGFIGGVTPENILRHPPARRNPLLADVFQKAGLVNRAGLGVDRIYEELLRLGKALPRYDAAESHVSLTIPISTHKGFARFVSQEQREQRRLELNDLIVLRTLTQRGNLDRWSAAKCLQLGDEESANILASLRNRGYLITQGRGRGTSYRLARRYIDLLRPTEGDHDLPLDDEAVRLRLRAILAERGRLTNADVRRVSGYSRTEAVRLMRQLSKEKIAVLVGRGRASHYAPGPAIKE